MYDFCTCVIVHLPESGLFLFILFYLPPDRYCYEIDPSTPNSCLIYCIRKSQLNNTKETFLCILGNLIYRDQIGVLWPVIHPEKVHAVIAWIH